ncbi:unnamed protein product [Candidula unifasciata]|uniref:Uncharacterized protein n=1 Tax=Candidula unifasciata TaxID=100452 RepID=A0A8S4A108_9EUPU|nr:unnamed protein product [Candidula unifasciata]
MEPQRPRSKSDEEVVRQLVTEGLLLYCLPSFVVCMGGMYLMRRRAATKTVSRVEQMALSALQYYGAGILGLGVAMQYYRPQFEQKVLEKIPNSTYAKLIRNRNARK